MNKYIDVDEQIVSKITEEEKHLVKQFAESEKEVLNKDLYTFVLMAYDKLVDWPYYNYDAFEFLKFVLKEAGLSWTAYDINVGDTIEIIDSAQVYSSYIDFFDENNIEKYKDKYIETMEGYCSDKPLQNKLAKVLFKGQHIDWKNDNDVRHELYVLSLKDNPDKIFLYNRLGISKV